MNDNTQQKHLMELAIDLNDIFELIYAESAWISAHNDKMYRLTTDNEAMLRMKVSEGYALLLPHLQPYLTWANFNPNISSRNLTLTLQFIHEPPESLSDTIGRVIVELLANYALMRFYHGQTQLYETAWRKSNSQLMLMWARDANGCILN